MQKPKSKKEMLEDLRRFQAAANDSSKTEQQRRIYAETVKNIETELQKLAQEKERKVQEVQQKAAPRPAANVPPNVRVVEPEPAAMVTVNENKGNARIVVSELDSIRKIEIIWPGESEAQVFTLSDISRLFNSAFNDMCKSWAAREGAYSRIPDRSKRQWMKATTYYYSAYILYGEWPTAKLIGVQNMSSNKRRTIFAMIVEHAQKM